MVWMRRDCAPEISFTAWDDVCQNIFYEVKIPGIPACAEDTYCEDIWITNLAGRMTKTIRCVPGSKPGVAQTRKQATDPQVGSSTTQLAPMGITTSTLYHQLAIANDMVASVSAFFMSEFLRISIPLRLVVMAMSPEGEDESFVVRPHNIIVGKIQGKEITVCAGDSSSPSKARECHPNGRHQLWTGDIIDFSWGLQSSQSGSLKYLVWPSKP
jgi:hypothetical protein